MVKWRIFYGDGRVSEGSTGRQWRRARDDDVQVVVVLAPPPVPPPDRFATGYVGCARKDCTFYTGVDKYDPLDYGTIKRGKLLSDDVYRVIWERAYGDN